MVQFSEIPDQVRDDNLSFWMVSTMNGLFRSVKSYILENVKPVLDTGPPAEPQVYLSANYNKSSKLEAESSKVLSLTLEL